MVTSGIANVAQWYVFGFGFTRVHWAFAWVTIGALAVHVAVKTPGGTGGLLAPDREVVAAEGRRAFVVGCARGRGRRGPAHGGLGGACRSRECPILRSRRPSTSPLGVPVNRTAAAAGIPASLDPADDESWSVLVRAAAGERTLTAAAIRALPQRTVSLPIACVEGWSAGGDVGRACRVRDVVAAAASDAAAGDAAHLTPDVGGDVRVVSAERHGVYRESVLPAPVRRSTPTPCSRSTLNGHRLTRDHGYPARIIAPDRPGVLQTKWVSRLEVLCMIGRVRRPPARGALGGSSSGRRCRPARRRRLALPRRCPGVAVGAGARLARRGRRRPRRARGAVGGVAGSSRPRPGAAPAGPRRASDRPRRGDRGPPRRAAPRDGRAPRLSRRRLRQSG